DLSKNLYKLWNRLSSGSYFPHPVKAVEIPKGNGGTRTLGIPTIADRIAQEVIKNYIEPRLEAVFVPSSYGYRPHKSAHDAIRSDLSKNLYKLWNRLSSGSYFPHPVKAVEIPKGNGGTRTLGIPTIADRIAQEVIKNYIEPRLEAVFVPSSYGYRPHKSAHDAI